MTTKHTPGEWSYRENGEDFTINTDSMPNSLAYVNIDEDITEEEAEANAKLIKAAPKLLENLQNMLFAFSASAKSNIQKKAIEYAREAVTNATA